MQDKCQGPKVNLSKINFRHKSCLISILVKFILILSHIGPPTMVAEAPDPHHGGPGRVWDGWNGLTGAHILRHKRVFKRNQSQWLLWMVRRRSLTDNLVPFVLQLPDFNYYRVYFSMCLHIRWSPGRSGSGRPGRRRERRRRRRIMLGFWRSKCA